MRGRAEGGVGGRSGHRLGRCGLAPERPLFRTPASQHQQQVLQAVERAKQVTVGELNSLIGVSHPGPCPGGGETPPQVQQVPKLGMLGGQAALETSGVPLRPAPVPSVQASLAGGVAGHRRPPAHPPSSLAAAAPAAVASRPPCAPHPSPCGAGGRQCHGVAGPVRSAGHAGPAGRCRQGGPRRRGGRGPQR